ncbi:MAG: hypothetical protein ACAH11_11960 [Sphingomonas sp.]
MTPATPLPYPGLRAFERDESHLFFGREKNVDELIARLAETRFLAVTGASGSGKSSLVRTGLLSALELGYFARAGAQWVIAEMHPGGQPLDNLADALTAVSPAEVKPSPAVLRRFLAQGPRSVIDWCESGNLAPNENLLILVDQFEELFRYSDYAAREEAEAFVAMLLESANNPKVPIHIVLTMRSEYLGACALIPGLAEEINKSLYLTPRLSRTGCREAIEGPARVCGLKVEPALSNQILNDLATFAPWEQDQVGAQGQLLSRRADQLPLMQHLLDRLWLRARATQAKPARPKDGKATTKPKIVTLSLADYDLVGGLSGALEVHGNEVLESLPAGDRAEVEHVFRALITGSDPTSAIRRPCRFDELVALLDGDEARARRIVDAFRAQGCNFLRPESKHKLEDDTIVDISHESLIRQWRVLSEWMRVEARADVNWRRLLRAEERYSVNEDGLLQGLNLDSLAAWWDSEQPSEAWARRHGGNYERIAAYLAESRKAKANLEAEKIRGLARERRRLLVTLAGVTLLLVVAGAGQVQAWLAGKQRSNATIAQAHAEADLAKAQADLTTARDQADAEIARANTEAQRITTEAQQKADASRREMEAKIKASDAKAAATDARLQRVMSIVEAGENLPNLVEYCGGGSNEQACRILFGRDTAGGNGVVRGRQ